ncbi:unnamed protein product [Merluccius merluccius]
MISQDQDVFGVAGVGLKAQIVHAYEFKGTCGSDVYQWSSSFRRGLSSDTAFTCFNFVLNVSCHPGPIETGSNEVKSSFNSHVAHVVVQTLQNHGSQLRRQNQLVSDLFPILSASVQYVISQLQFVPFPQHKW